MIVIAWASSQSQQPGKVLAVRNLDEKLDHLSILLRDLGLRLVSIHHKQSNFPTPIQFREPTMAR